MSAMPLTHGSAVRAEQPGDGDAVTYVNDAAFARTDESRLVEAIRLAGLATISLVATADANLVGHILFTPVTIDGSGAGDGRNGIGPNGRAP